MLTTRPLRPWDALFCWRLAHDEAVRESAVDRSKPTVWGHMKWMAKWCVPWLGEPERVALVVLAEAWGPCRCAWGGYQPTRVRERAGLVRAHREDDRAVISIEISPAFRGRGIGPQAIAAMAFAAQKNGWGTPTAYIRTDNVRSILAFRAAGFDVATHASGWGWVTMELRA